MFTNEIQLPAPVCRAIEWVESRHSRGDAQLSCTELIDAPLRFYLKERHGEDITVDYSDRLWSLYGTLMHQMLSNFSIEGDGQMLEEKVYSSHYDPDFRISGEIDYLMGNEVNDYKFTSAWAVKAGVKAEWEQQVNIYVDLLRKADDPALREKAKDITSVNIIALLRDWGVRLKKDIPHQVVKMPVDLWSPEKAEEFIKGRIAVHKEARASDQLPPECTEEQRWIREEGVAVMKEGRKSAVKVFKIGDDVDMEMAVKQANDFIASGEKGCSTSTCQAVCRKTEPRRCMDYCDVSEFCPYWQKRKEENDSWL